MQSLWKKLPRTGTYTATSGDMAEYRTFRRLLNDEREPLLGIRKAHRLIFSILSTF